MKAIVLSLEGKKTREIELPKVFEAPIHFELIKRAVLSIMSARKQPKGPSERSGRDYTAVYRGDRGLPTPERSINVGRARRPRTINMRNLLSGDVRGISGAVKGPKAHPPKPVKNIEEKINKKEKKQATASAIAASAKTEIVLRRNSLQKEIITPIVFENKIEEIKKTKEIMGILKKINLEKIIIDAKDKKKIRAGKGRKRGRKYKNKKTILFIATEKSNLLKAARNMEGTNISTPRKLNAELLAPGGLPGRITIWSEKAIQEIGKRFEKKIEE